MPQPPADDASALLERLYDAYGVSLYRYALIVLADRPSAEDVVQQVFAVLAARRGAALDDPERYLRRAVRNECYSALRRRAVRAEERVPLESVPGTLGDPAERVALERALRQLPAEQREAVHLHVFEGRTFHEAAELTGESLNTIASRYRYAIARLRGLLGCATTTSKRF